MMKKQRRENFEGFLFIGAGLLLFCVFILYPQLKNIYIAFSEYSIIPGAENKFVGLKNFKDMLFSSGTYGNSDSFYVALKKLNPCGHCNGPWAVDIRCPNCSYDR